MHGHFSIVLAVLAAVRMVNVYCGSHLYDCICYEVLLANAILLQEADGIS
jgi:hypothetical protein